jgi:hypothetical protein
MEDRIVYRNIFSTIGVISIVAVCLIIISVTLGG